MSLLHANESTAESDLSVTRCHVPGSNVNVDSYRANLSGPHGSLRDEVEIRKPSSKIVAVDSALPSVAG